jgi:D-amino peptidase
MRTPASLVKVSAGERMKILIAADMEGITGVVHGDQVTPGHYEYDRFRRLMTGDVNAAITGAFDGGADEVIVSDGHWDERNILVELLDPRARLNSGTPSPFSMVQGIDTGVDGVFFVGYHARAGTANAILDHTWSTSRIANLYLNGQVTGEIGLNAAVCGHFAVPVVMISGDQSACGEASALLGPVQAAIVKHAAGRTAAECLPPQISAEVIREAAYAAVLVLREGRAPRPWVLPSPVTVTLELHRADYADAAARMPGARRTAGRTVEFTAEDVPTAASAFRALASLAGA